jgi:hypothetical protein
MRPRAVVTAGRDTTSPTLLGEDPGPVPVGSRILHIGPHKTGTTALQAALHAARAELERQGVQYAGQGRHSASAVQAALGLPTPWSKRNEPPRRLAWRRLLLSIRRSSARRVLLSSEFFADGTPAAIRSVVDELDPARVHVVATLRPLARIIPSQWQQWVQNQLTESFDRWLDRLLHEPPSASELFWRRHRHDELIDRWSQIVGPDRMTVVVLDPRDHDFVFRSIERLTELVPGTLQPVPDYANRSLTLAEVEVIRAINIELADQGLARAEYNRLMRFGAAPLMKRREPRPGEARLELPSWSVAPIEAIQREIVDAVRASGVRVVGNLDWLTAPPVSRETSLDDVAVSPDVAASAAVAVLIATGVARGTADLRPADDADPAAGPMPTATRKVQEPPELLRVGNLQIAAVLARRARAALANRVSNLIPRRAR